MHWLVLGSWRNAAATPLGKNSFFLFYTPVNTGGRIFWFSLDLLGWNKKWSHHSPFACVCGCVCVSVFKVTYGPVEPALITGTQQGTGRNRRKAGNQRAEGRINTENRKWKERVETRDDGGTLRRRKTGRQEGSKKIFNFISINIERER